jgi:hypothetical protein
LPQTAQTGIGHGPTYILQASDISGKWMSIDQTIENFFLALRTHLAGVAFSAGFVSKKLAQTGDHF